MTNQKETPTKKSPNKDTEKANLTFDELPEGWIKEVKPRPRTPNRKDPYYIEVKSGYIFRSMKDVKKYIETGDVLNCKSRAQKMNKDQLEALKNKSSASKSGSKYVQLASGTGSKSVEPASGSGLKPVSPATSPKLKPEKKRGRKSSLTLKRKRSSVNKKETTPDPKTEETSSEPGHTEGRTGSRRVKPKKEREWATPARASPRLSGVNSLITTPEKADVDAPADMAIDVADVTQIGSGEIKPDPLVEEKVAFDDVKTDPLEEDKNKTGSDESETIPDPLKEDTGSIETKLDPITEDKKESDETEPDLLGDEAKPDPLEEKIIGDETKVDSLEEKTETVQMEEDSAVLFSKGQEAGPSMLGGGPGAGEKLPGGGPGAGDEKPGSPPLSSFFGDFWQDSCLGYAFKTLTGDMDEIPLDLGLENDKNVLTGPSNGPSSGVHIDNNANNAPNANEELKDNGVPKE